jgi:hypothetical protein
MLTHYYIFLLALLTASVILIHSLLLTTSCIAIAIVCVWGGGYAFCDALLVVENEAVQCGGWDNCSSVVRSYSVLSYCAESS